jgi:pimeloyl-ACP methyl ester carboxylesterase
MTSKPALKTIKTHNGTIQPVDALKEETEMNIVLVHGAWADGSSWSAVIERLQAGGHTVTAPQFPMAALADDVARLRQVLRRQDGPTLLAGHSYGASPGYPRTTSSITSPPTSIQSKRKSCSRSSSRWQAPLLRR